MHPGDLLPTSGLPRTDYPAGKEIKWLFESDREKYHQRGGHPLYGENDIIYRFYSLGYRCPEFDAVADIHFVAIGCSYVMGSDLPQHALFHELFAEKLRALVSPKTVVVWNLGLAGASNDYISRLLYLALPQLDPHILLINFTHMSRREYVSVQKQHINYIPNYIPTDEVTKDIFHHFASLSSPFDDQLNFFRNYKAIECLLTGCQWLYSHSNKRDFESMAGHVDLNNFAGLLRPIDRARDHWHPGPKSHRRLAELYWAKFIELGGLAESG